MQNLMGRIRRCAEDYNMICTGDKIAVGVSGGKDSLSLLYLLAALRRYFTGQSMQTAIDAMPFRSAKKYGGVSFHEDETYLLGAPEILLANCPEKEQYLPLAEEWSAKGCRVLLLALYDGKLSDEALDAEMMPLALILLSIIPVIVFYLLCQKYIIKGVAAGAVKG